MELAASPLVHMIWMRVHLLIFLILFSDQFKNYALENEEMAKMFVNPPEEVTVFDTINTMSNGLSMLNTKPKAE
jgi:hypothetical protein